LPDFSAIFGPIERLQASFFLARRSKGFPFFYAMSMALSRFTQWLWPGSAAAPVAAHEHPNEGLTSSSFPDFPSGFREPDTVTFYTGRGAGGRRARPRRVRNRRRSRGEPRVDREYDMVIVPSDGGGCLSGSDSDDSDWSIGWLEPQAPELQTDGDPENCFAVLVPCYRHGRQEQQPGRHEGRFLGAGTLTNGGFSGERADLVCEFNVLSFNFLTKTKKRSCYISLRIYTYGKIQIYTCSVLEGNHVRY
jgi:hypothetical protein